MTPVGVPQGRVGPKHQPSRRHVELSQRAATLDGEERHDVEKRIQAARDLMGAKDAVERFLQWTIPDDAEPDLEDDDDANDDEA